MSMNTDLGAAGCSICSRRAWWRLGQGHSFKAAKLAASMPTMTMSLSRSCRSTAERVSATAFSTRARRPVACRKYVPAKMASTLAGQTDCRRLITER
jgi:hypothetical protein